VKTIRQRSDDAFRAGHQAGLDGLPWSACPFKAHQGSPDRIEALAWRKGFQSAEVDEAEGAHFKSKT
jgi:ribosome modulation factor